MGVSMISFLRAASLLLAACLFTGPAASIDPFFPTHGNNGIDVLSYDLEIDVRPGTGRIEAMAELAILAEQELERFSLDLHGLDVSRVTVNGFRANFSRVGGKLNIRPLSTIPRGLPFLVLIEYSGVPATLQDPTIPDDPSARLGWFKYRNQTYVLSEPIGASTFFPANDEPTDKALFRFSLTVPKPYTAVANGVLTTTRNLGASQRFVWEMRQPMTTWLATVQVNRFSVFETRAPNGIPVRVYSTPTTPPAHIQDYALSAQMLPVFERWMGPYPFEAYASVVIDDPTLFYALETQTVSSFPLGWADQFVVAHELAHQWFGNSAAIEKWEDLWIAEGAATYFEIFWPNHNDREAFDAEMLALYDYIVANNVGPAVVDEPDQMFTARTYYRGASALYALRLTVGDQKFFDIMTAFATLYRGRNADSQDFIRVAVEISGDGSVRGLLEDWLYDEPVPPLPAAAAALTRRANVDLSHLVGFRCGPRGVAEACAHHHAGK